jgi:hypothetical protein
MLIGRSAMTYRHVLAEVAHRVQLLESNFRDRFASGFRGDTMSKGIRLDGP